MSELFSGLNKTNLLIIILAIVIVGLFILNHRKQNQINALLNSTSVTKSEPAIEKFNNPSNDIELNLYYTEWCGYSQRFLPVWAEFEQYAASNNLNIKLNKIDCDKEKEKCQSIPGFPTIILSKNGKQISMDYKYPRTVDGLKKFIAENL